VLSQPADRWITPRTAQELWCSPGTPELGRVPLPGGVTPAGEVRGGSERDGERVERLRDHGEAEEDGDLKEVVRADDEPKHTPRGDPVRLLSAVSAAGAVTGPQPREQPVVVEVAG